MGDGERAGTTGSGTTASGTTGSGASTAATAEQPPARAVRSDADVVQLVREFVAGIPRRDTYVYTTPDAATRRALTACANLLMAGAPVAEVTARAEPQGYEAVAFYDEVMDRTLSVLRPKPGAVVRPAPHWGLYVFSPQAELDVVIHAPHPVFDTHSDLMAAQAFRGSRARALFVAGAHRYARGDDPAIADVARYVPSVFNDIHRASLKALGPRAVVQFHGYARTEASQHTPPDTPAAVNVVVSAGLTRTELGADPPPPAVALVEAIKDDLRRASAAFLPNQQWVVGLMAHDNEQRKVMRARTPGVSFVHVETDDSLRIAGPSGTWDADTTRRLGLTVLAAVARHT
jgi:hypothetical protein